jgi:segregation and condensation protein B
MAKKSKQKASEENVVENNGTPEAQPEERAEPEAEATAEVVASDAVADAAEVGVNVLAEERPATGDDAQLRAILEAIVYVTDEPLSAQQIAAALERPLDVVKRCLDELVAEWAKAEHGLAIREVAGGYKMSTKPEHHEAVRAFVKKLTPPLKLSLPALETLAVIAYKQPVTGPEIMEIRGVQGAGVLKTLLDRKLIAESGRKNVVGKPILYKTTKEFLVQFGLKSVNELPTLKEFEELGRMEIAEPDNQTSLPLGEAPPSEAVSSETGVSEAGAAEQGLASETVVEVEREVVSEVTDEAVAETTTHEKESGDD